MHQLSRPNARLRRLWSPRLLVPAEVTLVFVICAALLLRRPTGGRLWQTLWAEDGTEFVNCQLRSSFGFCLKTPYTGYLQFWPRLLAPIVVAFPPRDWALMAALLAVAFAALSLGIVYWSAAWLVPSRLVRLFGVAVISASAAAHWAPLGNLANLHWFLFLSGFFLAVDRNSSGSWWWTALRTVWIASVCLSEALGPVILGAYLVGLVLRRLQRGSWRASDAAGAVLVALSVGVQLYEYVRFPRARPPHTGNETVIKALRQYPELVLRQGWMGATQNSENVGRAAIVVTLVLLAGGLVAVAIGARRGTLQTRFLLPLAWGVVLGVASIGAWEANVLVNDAVGARYIFVPFALIVFAALAVLANLYALSGMPRPALVPALAGLAATVALLAVSPYLPLVATHQPAWHGQLADARRRCADTGPNAEQTILIAPHVGWAVVATCRQLAG